MKKNILKSICALVCCGAALLSCSKDEAPEGVISVDVASITDVEAQNPADVSVAVTSNVNWIVQAPEWITPSAAFGSGDAILTFAFATNYKDEKTNTNARSGEIRISGGGSLTGKGASVVIPVNQLGHTYIDPNPSLGGIDSAAEFADFIKAANSGGSLKRWTDENGEVVLLADVDLTDASVDWQSIADAADVLNANNDCTVNGTPFTGIFNGNGYKITGFSPVVELGANKTFGLFAAISGATIKNVTLEGTMTVTATGQADAGMLVGTALNSTVSNVKVSGKVISAGTSVAQRFALGGVCGFACAKDDVVTLFDNCVSDVEADVVGGANEANGAACAMYGGIVGFSTTPKAIGAFNVTIKDCINNGDMNVTLGRCSGILATANSGTTLQGCVNNGDQVNGIANGRLGNVVCNLAYNSHIFNCVNNGDLDATAEGYKGTVGGIFALAGDKTSVIEGGGNYGTIKTLSTAGKYIGLLWANHNNEIPTKGLVASGRIIVDGVEREINASNYMDNIGYMKKPEFVTDITWVAPGE